LGQVATRLRSGVALEVIGVLALCVALVLLIAFIVFVEQARRKVPDQLRQAARRASTRRRAADGDAAQDQHGGRHPRHLRVFDAGLPADDLAVHPVRPGAPESWRSRIHLFFQSFHGGDPYYELFFLSLIVIFTFFYITIIFNVEEVADNLRKHGGFIPASGRAQTRPSFEHDPDAFDDRRRHLSRARRARRRRSCSAASTSGVCRFVGRGGRLLQPHAGVGLDSERHGL
jgi:preprotein translocase subunit SecY